MSSMLDLPALAASAPTAPPRRPALRAVPVLPLDFEAVVRSLTPRLQRYATRRLGDAHEAEELVQEALLRAYDHRAELATEDDVAAWTTCVTGRLVIDRLRVRGRSTSMAEVPEGSRVGRDTADVVVARDEARLALDALDAMPSRQAAVLWAREVEGLSYDAIGDRFALTEPAVRSLLSRARKALRQEFATRGGTLPAAGLVSLAPWLDGLTWLDRLRAMATRAAAPTALGMAAAGLLGGVLLTPWIGAPADAAGKPTTPRAVVLEARSSALPQPLPARPGDASAALTSGAPAAAPAPVAPPAGSTPVLGLDVLDDTGVNGTCADAAGAGAGGAGCGSARGPVLRVDPDVAPGALGVEALGVELDDIDCVALPDTPLTQCTTAQGDDR